jgi:hypothetical protein
MAAPTYSNGTNLLNGVSLAAGKNAAALIDLSTVIQGLVWVLMETGATAPTVGTTFSLRRVVGAKATGNTTITNSGGIASGATSITIGSATNIVKNRLIALISASTGVGEIVTATAVSGTTITISATENAYNLNDLVFLVEDIASGGTIVPSSSGTWAANTPYDTTLYPPIGVWILHAANGDGTQAVTVTSLADEVATIQ